MITTRKEAKERIAEYAKLLDIVMNKRCTVAWDKFQFELTVLNIDLAKTTGRKNVPDKRDNKSPMLFVITTDVGELVFTLDDAAVTSIYNGIRILIPQDNPIGEADILEVDIKLC